MFKLRNRKTLAQRVGSVEGSPLKARAKPPPPACAHETTTSSGIKHLRIVIPTESLCNDLPITLPVSGSGSKRRSRHVSIAWTEEMLNPLASLELENAISGFNLSDAMSPITPTTPVRSPKRSPVSAERITLEGHDHPLASREEQTKARKLRDLRKNKAKKEGNETEEENAHEGAQSESDMSPASAPDSTPASSGSEADEGNAASKMDYLEAIVQSLQGQNTRLTQALAKVVGLDSDHGTLDPEAVLKAFERAESRVRQEMNNAADNI
ncbi:hypothetical protein BS50DRAFT_572298 [Corynespora cassiicola Philippines]|uniref:Uncharacterized protein n=1 Tax=Corynespora cassiicola Philippines TaxID=1448308 RepID=A0A2T2NUL2_CORCC|nr:hypothetical protein BS50DRAFT_572298 [Corynespora cassiicola Philippines]